MKNDFIYTKQAMNNEQQVYYKLHMSVVCLCYTDNVMKKNMEHIRPGHLRFVITQACFGTHLNENWHLVDCMYHKFLIKIKNLFSP